MPFFIPKPDPSASVVDPATLLNLSAENGKGSSKLVAVRAGAGKGGKMEFITGDEAE